MPTHGTCGIARGAYVHGPVRANIFFGRGFDLQNFLNSEIHIVFGVQLLELSFAALWKVYRGSETHLQSCMVKNSVCNLKCTVSALSIIIGNLRMLIK